MARPYNSPEDTLQATDSPIANASLQHFWRWAFGDLCDDDIKGVFGEWLVLKLLDIPSLRRCSWANNDLCTKDGITIEIKVSSYWQSWKMISGNGKLRDEPLRPATRKEAVVFSGLKAWDASDLLISEPARFKSQLYVFAFPKEIDYERWNAMDLTQWEFYIRKAGDLSHARIRLVDLERSTPPLNAEEFRLEALRMIEELKEENNEQKK
jgi:hypothetical protein